MPSHFTGSERFIRLLRLGGMGARVGGLCLIVALPGSVRAMPRWSASTTHEPDGAEDDGRDLPKPGARFQVQLLENVAYRDAAGAQGDRMCHHQVGLSGIELQ